MAATLVGRGMKPEVIATSPLVRCVETAQLLSVAAGKVEVVELDELLAGQRLRRPAAMDGAPGPQASADRLGVAMRPT